jgi:hypothetical protein
MQKNKRIFVYDAGSSSLKFGLFEAEGEYLHGQGARSGSGLGGAVNDPYSNSEPGQPKGQYQAGRPGANNHDEVVAHIRLAYSG